MTPSGFIEKELNSRFSSQMLTILILGFALFLIFLALTVKNPLAKAGILAWVILP